MTSINVDGHGTLVEQSQFQVFLSRNVSVAGNFHSFLGVFIVTQSVLDGQFDINSGFLGTVSI